MLVVDTGVLVAAADRSDREHVGCAELLEPAGGPAITTALVVAECAYPIGRELGGAAEALLYQSIFERTLIVEPLQLADWARARDPVTTYGDTPLGGTDASGVAIAEPLGLAPIGTLDRRPVHRDAFEIVP